MTKPVVDIHGHFYPEPHRKLVAQEGERFGARLSSSHSQGPVIQVGPLRVEPLKAVFTDLDCRKKETDRHGVRVHALSITVPMVYWADADLGLRLARAVNDAITQAHTAFPDRFVGFATLPMQEPKVAVEVIGAQRLAPYYLGNLLGNLFDIAVVGAHLIFGGVLDRFKRLRVCLPHAGGAFPYLVGQLNRGWKVRNECRHLKRPPSAYRRRLTYDTVSHRARGLRYLIGLVGADRVMLGSDGCFDMGYERPGEVITRPRGLSQSDQARILGGNALRLLRVGE